MEIHYIGMIEEIISQLFPHPSLELGRWGGKSQPSLVLSWSFGWPVIFSEVPRGCQPPTNTLSYTKIALTWENPRIWGANWMFYNVTGSNDEPLMSCRLWIHSGMVPFGKELGSHGHGYEEISACVRLSQGLVNECGLQSSCASPQMCFLRQLSCYLLPVQASFSIKKERERRETYS